MFEILDGRKDFYQWDIDRKLIIKDENISQVHFCNKTGECSLVCDAYTENGKRLVDVPNILLQSDWKITVYAYDDNHTKYCDTFKVIKRSKPEDYVYTPEELKVWNELENRIEVIESSYATEEYVDKAISEIDITGFVKHDEAQELTNEQKAQARANIDSADAKATADALATKITTPTVATVGQAMVVKAVDEAGKPIEWECADMGEIITLEETVLASGTIAAADIVKGMKLDTGLTVADMKKWKTFSFRYETTSANICINFKFSNPAAPAYYTVLYYEWHKSMSAFFTWVDTKKTALRIDNATKNTLAPGIGSAMVANGWMNRFANANQVSQYIKHHMADNYIVMIENVANDVNADLRWEIRGILK